MKSIITILILVTSTHAWRWPWQKPDCKCIDFFTILNNYNFRLNFHDVKNSLNVSIAWSLVTWNSLKFLTLASRLLDIRLAHLMLQSCTGESLKLLDIAAITLSCRKINSALSFPSRYNLDNSVVLFVSNCFQSLQSKHWEYRLNRAGEIEFPVAPKGGQKGRGRGEGGGRKARKGKVKGAPALRAYVFA